MHEGRVVSLPNMSSVGTFRFSAHGPEIKIINVINGLERNTFPPTAAAAAESVWALFI